MNLEEIQDKINQYRGVVRENRIWFIITTLSFGIGLAIYAFLSPAYYTAHASFHPETNSNSNSMIPSNPLSLLFGSGGLDGIEADRMEEVLKSRKLSEAVVNDSIILGKEKIFLPDVVIEKYPKNIFTFFKSPSELSKEKKIIRAGQYIKKGLVIEKVESGFLNMNFSFNDQELTEILSKRYIEHLSKYYTNQKTEKAQINLDFFKERAAFVKRQLDSTAINYALFQDRNKRLRFARQMIRAKEMETKLDYLGEMYKTLVTNREQAASQLQRATPIIQVLDEPTPPFKVSRKLFPIFFILGLLLGAFISALWLTRKLIWADLLSSIKESMNKPPEE